MRLREKKISEPSAPNSTPLLYSNLKSNIRTPLSRSNLGSAITTFFFVIGLIFIVAFASNLRGVSIYDLRGVVTDNDIYARSYMYSTELSELRSDTNKNNKITPYELYNAPSIEAMINSEVSDETQNAVSTPNGLEIISTRSISDSISVSTESVDNLKKSRYEMSSSISERNTPISSELTSNVITKPTYMEVPPNQPKGTCCSHHFLEIIKPFANETTVYLENDRGFYSGFQNQMMAFTSFIIWTRKKNWGQTFIFKLRHKDTFGTNMMIPFTWLFDVEHWNSHYPALPRLVGYNSSIHKDFDGNKFKVPIENATAPFAFTTPQHRLFGQYKRYTKQLGLLAEPKGRHDADLLMKRGALRPNPELLEFIDSFLENLTKGGGGSYMTLHARIEPDMIKHPVCRDRKVTNLTKIFEHLENIFPDPPASHLFLPIGRKLMEKKLPEDDPHATLVVENLAALNRAVKKGLWNGKVKCFEFGSDFLKDTKYARYSATTGAWVNFYLAIKSKLFVGTEISSWSHSVMETRFYRGNLENYKYLPTGIKKWTTEDMDNTDPFGC